MISLLHADGQDIIQENQDDLHRSLSLLLNLYLSTAWKYQQLKLNPWIWQESALLHRK